MDADVSKAYSSGAAIVTGGAGGIGQAICRKLNAAGRRVAVVDIVAPRTSDFFVRADLAVAGAGRAAVDECIQQLGPVEVVVNAIGVYQRSTLSEFSWARMDENMRVNVYGPLEVILQWLVTSPPCGRIVNLASAAVDVGSRDIAYSASKAALRGITRSLARSLAPQNIQCYSISPGVIDTPMSARMLKSRRNEHVSRTVVRRMGSAEEVADLVGFLVSGQAAYMTGADFVVAGGLVW